eukprot:2538185-Pyramimonas_sp.AAC.1
MTCASLRASADPAQDDAKPTSERRKFGRYETASGARRGPLQYWTDSEIVYNGWVARRSQRPAEAGTNGDAWKEIEREFQQRGPADE